MPRLLIQNLVPEQAPEDSHKSTYFRFLSIAEGRTLNEATMAMIRQAISELELGEGSVEMRADCTHAANSGMQGITDLMIPNDSNVLFLAAANSRKGLVTVRMAGIAIDQRHRVYDAIRSVGTFSSNGQ